MCGYHASVDTKLLSPDAVMDLLIGSGKLTCSVCGSPNTTIK